MQESTAQQLKISYNEYVTGSYKRSRLGIYAHIYRLLTLIN